MDSSTKQTEQDNMNIQNFKIQCEKEIQSLAKFRPILCPIFEVMAENIDASHDNMSVTSFVDMCLVIADSRS